MPQESAELRFDEPTSIAEGRKLLEQLKQSMSELQATLSVFNLDKPPRHQAVNYERWKAARGRRISDWRRVTAHYKFIKTWLHQTEQNTFSTISERPSVYLHRASHTVRCLEELWAAVGDFLESDSDEEYEVMRQKYRDASTALGKS